MKGYDDEHLESCRCASCVQALRAWNAANTAAAQALRLADAAVIEAAEDYIGKNMTEESLVENRWGHQPERIRLGLAVVRRRKALAEQAKGVTRG